MTVSERPLFNGIERPAFVRPALIRGGLLLSDAMNRAESPHQIRAGDSHYLAQGKEFLQGGQCPLVIRTIIRRHQYGVIGDIKIGIAGRETSPLILNG